MTLAFSEHLNGKPTHFVEKILKSEKIHTIRQDMYNRWKADNLIHFVINNRTPERFQFAPIIKCKSVQSIKIRYIYDARTDAFTIPYVSIDEKILSNEEVKKLALNDGFESVKDFFKYFKYDFKGKLIHWTDFKY